MDGIVSLTPMLAVLLGLALLATALYALRQRRSLKAAKLAHDRLYSEFLEAMEVSRQREDLRARASQLFRESADQVDDLIGRLSRAGAEIERLQGLLYTALPADSDGATPPLPPRVDGAPSRVEIELRYELRRLQDALAQAAPDEVWARRFKDAKRRFATTFHPDLLGPDAPDRAARELAFKLFYDELTAISTS